MFNIHILFGSHNSAFFSWIKTKQKSRLLNLLNVWALKLRMRCVGTRDNSEKSLKIRLLRIGALNNNPLSELAGAGKEG